MAHMGISRSKRIFINSTHQRSINSYESVQDRALNVDGPENLRKTFGIVVDTIWVIFSTIIVSTISQKSFRFSPNSAILSSAFGTFLRR